MRRHRSKPAGPDDRTGSGALGEPGDLDDFDEFVLRSLRPLTRAALVVTWNLADAEDAVQEALYQTAKR